MRCHWITVAGLTSTRACRADGQLVAKGYELKFERSAAAEAKREQGNQCGKNDKHADDGMAAAL